jgi:hypothetical protein
MPAINDLLNIKGLVFQNETAWCFVGFESGITLNFDWNQLRGAWEPVGRNTTFAHGCGCIKLPPK